MKLNVGVNIKKLRLAKGLTQQQLAELLNVSGAAVSKWEAQNTYPDITVLFPLANVFGVSMDELLGYDAAKTEAEIKNLLAEYWHYRTNGDFEKAREILNDTRRNYPNDYTVMYTYMWEKAGGSVRVKAALLENQEEFTQICDCILSGCTEEKLRLDALAMKANLLHAAGDTDGALKILEDFPSWDQTVAQKTEQLFFSNSLESKYWVKRNAYSLFDGVAAKLVSMIWHDDALDRWAKIRKIEELGDGFSYLRRECGMAFFALPEHMVYALLANKLSEDELEDVIRIREKQFVALETMMALSRREKAFLDQIMCTYKTDALLKWTVDRLTNARHPHFEKLREHPEYQAMLQKWHGE